MAGLSQNAKKAVVLLSGGMDSATCLAIATKDNYDCYAISFRYGQRHEIELKAAKRLAYTFGVVKHLVIDIDMTQIGGSALTTNIDVPKDRDGASNMTTNLDTIRIPVTYVPARNTVFLSFALSWAETLDASDIFIGVNAVDYSGYPDCRPEYIAAFETMAKLATANPRLQSLRIRTPLAAMSKKEIVEQGIGVGVDFNLTHTCYDPIPATSAEKSTMTGTIDNVDACGRCDACILRLKGFQEAGITDPIAYAPIIDRIHTAGSQKPR